MASTTSISAYRTHGGSTRRASPAVLHGSIMLKADCSKTAKQIIGVLPKNGRIVAVNVVGNDTAGGTQPAAGTFQMDLEATAAPLPVQALVNVVAAGGTLSAIGSKTVVAASLLRAFPTERQISVTIAAGVAGQWAWFAIEIIPFDDGRLSS